MYKEIPFTEGKYSIDEFGNVRRNAKPSRYRRDRGVKERTLRPWKNNKGYYQVDLRIEGRTCRYLVHRLVAMVFIENPKNYKLINHKDSNPENNHVSNLEWCDHSYNNKYAYDFGNRILTDKQMECRKRPKFYLYKKVAKLDKDTLEVLDVYDSITHAAKLNGISLSSVSACCNDRKYMSCGFKWKFI